MSPNQRKKAEGGMFNAGKVLKITKKVETNVLSDSNIYALDFEFAKFLFTWGFHTNEVAKLTVKTNEPDLISVTEVNIKARIHSYLSWRHNLYSWLFSSWALRQREVEIAVVLITGSETSSEREVFCERGMIQGVLNDELDLGTMSVFLLRQNV